MKTCYKRKADLKPYSIDWNREIEQNISANRMIFSLYYPLKSIEEIPSDTDAWKKWVEIIDYKKYIICA